MYFSAEYHAASPTESLQQVFFLFPLAELARPALFNNWHNCCDENDKHDDVLDYDDGVTLQ